MENQSLMPSRLPQKLTEGEGGSYHSWDTSVFPFLGEGNVSGAELILKPRGFALPHFYDSSKIGYVIHGTDGVVAMINPGCTEEKVAKLEKGDAILVQIGAVSWWFNAGNDDLKIIFLGETHNATTPGEFGYCFLAGATGILRGFSPKILSQAYKISEEQVNELTNSQKKPLIITLAEEEKTSMPKPSNHESLTIKFDQVKPDISVENGGSLNTLTSTELYPPLDEGIQLSGKLLKLDPNAMFGPSYYERDSAVELVYVTKGSGWVQVVGMNGQVVLDTQLEAGHIYGVPKFYVVAIGAGNQGIECFSIITTSRPILGELAGKRSLWRALSPQVVQSSFNLKPELRKLFMDNINKTTIISPPN